MLGGLLVWVDIAILQAGIWHKLDTIKAKIRFVVLGTLAHLCYGLIGLGLYALGGMASQLVNVAATLLLLMVGYVGICFTSHGLANDEEPDKQAIINILKRGGFITIMVTLSPYSIDELFAILQRVGWMLLQGWSGVTIMASMILSMLVLLILLTLSGWLFSRKAFRDWAERNDALLMFMAFGLINYHVMRSLLQNAMGFEGVVFEEIPYTGIAWLLLIVMIFITKVQKWALGFQGFRRVWLSIFVDPNKLVPLPKRFKESN